MTEALTPTEKSKKQRDNTKNATKNFDYTTIADRLRTVSWGNDSHPAILAIRAGFRATDSFRARGITSDFYGPMNVHRGTVISAIVTVNLFSCILYGRATLWYKSHIA